MGVLGAAYAVLVDGECARTRGNTARRTAVTRSTRTRCVDCAVTAWNRECRREALPATPLRQPMVESRASVVDQQFMDEVGTNRRSRPMHEDSPHIESSYCKAPCAARYSRACARIIPSTSMRKPRRHPCRLRPDTPPSAVSSFGRGARSWPVLRPNRAPRNAMRSTRVCSVAPLLASRCSSASRTIVSRSGTYGVRLRW